MQSAEELIQAAVQERSSLARREVVLSRLVLLHAEDAMRERSEAAGGVLLELVSGERRIAAEAQVRGDGPQRRFG